MKLVTDEFGHGIRQSYCLCSTDYCNVHWTPYEGKIPPEPIARDAPTLAPIAKVESGTGDGGFWGTLNGWKRKMFDFFEIGSTSDGARIGSDLITVMVVCVVMVTAAMMYQTSSRTQ